MSQKRTQQILTQATKRNKLTLPVTSRGTTTRVFKVGRNQGITLTSSPLIGADGRTKPGSMQFVQQVTNRRKFKAAKTYGDRQRAAKPLKYGILFGPGGQPVQ